MTDAIALRCGTLRLQIDRADLPLDELCGFASRRSRKRGFVFVSKVLGKHYPVRPARMAEVHARLAAKLGALAGPVVLIALAETATGLGHGIAEAWQRLHGRDDLLFLHTTRYLINRPLALTFDEAHSHATEHLLYRPIEPGHNDLFRVARTLVLVDDEMSTGRTLANLASAYRRLVPRLEPGNEGLAAVHLACVTDWLGTRRRDEITAQIGLPTKFHSLLEGSYHLEPDKSFDPGPIPNADGPGDCKDACLPRNHGRLGVRGLLRYDLDDMIRPLSFRGGERVLVLGTGEFTHPPFLLARRLEELGCDVSFQSTTRSPLLVDRDITSALEFVDNYHDGIANYVYNVSDRHYDRIVIGYETSPLPTAHRLGELCGAVSIMDWRREDGH